MLICLEILKQGNIYESPKLLGEWLLGIFKISQIILHSSTKQTQEIHDKQVPKYNFIKKLLTNSSQPFLWFSRLAIDHEYPRE